MESRPARGSVTSHAIRKLTSVDCKCSRFAPLIPACAPAVMWVVESGAPSRAPNETRAAVATPAVTRRSWLSGMKRR